MTCCVADEYIFLLLGKLKIYFYASVEVVVKIFLFIKETVKPTANYMNQASGEKGQPLESCRVPRQNNVKQNWLIILDSEVASNCNCMNSFILANYYCGKINEA
jgi:hypothetical protein